MKFGTADSGFRMLPFVFNQTPAWNNQARVNISRLLSLVTVGKIYCW